MFTDLLDDGTVHVTQESDGSGTVLVVDPKSIQWATGQARRYLPGSRLIWRNVAGTLFKYSRPAS
jgi:hypothetical protein